MNSRSFGALLLGLALVAPAREAAADDTGPGDAFSVNVALTTDYRFRGQSQSQTDPAVQGGLDWVSPMGLFAGAWASSVDFNDAADTSVELDLYFGYTAKLGERTTATLKGIFYLYPDADYPPGSDEYDYFEATLNLAHDFGPFQAFAEIYWSPDYFFETGTGVTLDAGLTVPLTDKLWFFDGGVSLSGKVAYQWIDDNIAFGTPDYLFYDIGVFAKAGIATFDVRYVDTDLSDAECFGGTNLCEGAVIATLTFNFAL